MADPRLIVEVLHSSPPEPPVFYYDLADVECYLAAEQLSALPVEWEPVVGDRKDVDRRWIARRAADLGIQPLRWPKNWPPDSRDAMLAATYAKGIGRSVAFSLAAFRQVFAGGRELGDLDTVLIAGAAAEIHPSALSKAIRLRSAAEALERAGARASEVGVTALPAIQIGAAVFEGEDLLEAASAALSS